MASAAVSAAHRSSPFPPLVEVTSRRCLRTPVASPSILKTSLTTLQEVAGISHISFIEEETVSPKKPLSKAKQRELSGRLEGDTEARLKKQISDAKNKELSGHNIFAPPPEIKPQPLTAHALALRERISIGESSPQNMAPMHVKIAREVPEYEIDPKELDFTNSVGITKGTFTIGSWHGTQVAVKKLGDELLNDKDKVRAFRDELELLQKIRHPNDVQFIGPVTQSSPMMNVAEYLPKGDLRAFLKRKGVLKPLTALKFAMDLARGMNYLHENKPEPIIHKDLEPTMILDI